MPLSLRHLDAANRRSSQYHHLRPIRFADKRLGFVLAPASLGWYVIPVLGPNPALSLNGRPVGETTRLAIDDRLTLGSKRFAVETCTSSDEPHGPLLAAEATVRVRSGNRTLAKKRLSRPCLIGSDKRAALAAPADTGLAPEHAVVAHLADRWHLFVLGGPGAYRLGEKPTSALVLVPGESVWLNDRVEITLECEALDPLDLLARTTGTGSHPSVPALRGRPDSPARTPSGEETPPALSLDPAEPPPRTGSTVPSASAR